VQQRGSRYEIQLGDLPFLHQTSVVNVQGIGSLIEARLERKLGQLPAATMAKVKEAIVSRSDCDLVILAQMTVGLRVWT
jgi:mRNA-degrading endonuclease toxin of MazEF toxin-antitoxin module